MNDVVRGIVGWRVWYMLTAAEINKRYRRSVFGQFWYTLSMALTVLGIGFVYGGLFNQPYLDFVAYLTVTFPLWYLISNMMNDSAQSFINSEAQLKHYAFPCSTFVFQMILRNLFIFAHNIVLIVPVFLIARKWPGLPVLAFVPALVAYVLTGVWLGLLFGTIGTRFRDVPQIISSVTSLAFFVTPVMFRPISMPERLQFVIDHNPFAALLAIGRDPLLGHWPRASDWFVVGLITVLGFAVALPVFGRYRRFIRYWL